MIPMEVPALVVDLRNAESVRDVFDRAGRANLMTSTRQGSTVHLPDSGRLLITGDLHDHSLNYQRILKLAKLHESPSNHLILHEVVHGDRRINGADMSIQMLAKVAALKAQYPEQVHILQSNHELSQIRNERVLKNGVSMTEAFNAGVEYIYGNEADAVRGAMETYIKTFMMAVKLPCGIMVSHSLPAPRHMIGFDIRVIERMPTAEDFSPKGSAYKMVWGRKHDRDQLDELARKFGVKLFITGHQPAEMGYDTEFDKLLVLASEHSHGVALPVDLSRDYTMNQLIEALVPLASVALY